MEKNLLILSIFALSINIQAQAPIANFSAQVDSTCGSSLTNNFTDLSSNTPTSWKWYFPGATPDTSSLRNPTNIQYNGYGCYTVKLVVKNNNGSDSLIDSNIICLDPLPSITITGSSACQGQPDTVTLSSSKGRYYKWSTGQTTSSFTLNFIAIISETYTIGLQSGACYKDTSVTISVDTPPQTYFKGDTSICVGDSAIIYALPLPGHGSYGYSYFWNTGSTADSIVVSANSPGVYTYYVSITKGACSKDSSKISVRVNVCTGIENYKNPLEIEVFPNPASNKLLISLNNADKNNELIITDITGRKVQCKVVEHTISQLNIDISSLSPGIYFLQMQTDKGAIVKKFMKD